MADRTLNSEYYSQGKDIDRLEDIIRMQGEEPPPSDTGGAVSKFFDILDTPKQFSQGGIMYGLGLPGYEKDFMEATRKARDENIYTGEILRKISQDPNQGVLQDVASFFFPQKGDSPEKKVARNVLRGVTSFVGDVVTDPLSYLTTTAKGAVKAGGAALSDDLLKTVSKEFQTPVEIFAKAEQSSLDDLLKDIAGKNFSDTELLQKIPQLQVQANRDASFAFELANQVRKEAKDLKRGGLLQNAAKEVGLSIEGLKPTQVIDEIISRRKNIAELVDVEDAVSSVYNRGVLAKNKLLLDEPVALEELFRKSGFKLDFNELPFGREIGRFTGINLGGDTPILTDLSSEIIESLDDLFYSGVRGVKAAHNESFKYLKELTKDSPRLSKAVGVAEKTPAKAVEALRGLSGLLSRRVLATGKLTGSQGVSDLIKENEAAEMYAMSKAAMASDVKFLRANGSAIPEEVLGDASFVFDEFAKKRSDDLYKLRQKFVTPEGEIPPSMLGAYKKEEAKVLSSLNTRDIFLEGVTKLKDKYNLQEAGLGDDLGNVLLSIRDDFSNFAKKEMEAGVLESAKESYLNKAYVVRPGFDLREKLEGFRRISDASSGGNPAADFWMQQVFQTKTQAMAQGLEPITDLKYLYSMRKYAHEVAMGAKDFHDRSMLLYGLPKETADRILRDAMGNSTQRSKDAIAYLHMRGLKFSPEEMMAAHPTSPLFTARKEAFNNEEFKRLNQIISEGGAPAVEAQRQLDDVFDAIDKSADPVWGVLRKPKWASDAGNVISNDAYLQYERLIKNPEFGSIEDTLEAKKMAKDLGFTFSAREKADYKILYDNYLSSLQQIPGRFGELVSTRAGTIELPGSLKRMVARAGATKNITPEEKKFFDGLLPIPYVRAIQDSYDTRGLLESQIQKAAKGGDPDPLRDAKVVLTKGWLSFLKASKLMATLPWPSHWMRNANSAQFQAMQSARILGMVNPYSLVKDQELFNALKAGKDVDIFTDFGKRVSGRSIMEAMRQYGIGVDFDSAIEYSNSWANTMLGVQEALGEKGKKTLLGQGKDLYTAVENFGRKHLFLNLVRQGSSFDDAAKTANKVMVDYVRGKTGFERKYINNIMFFYAFARGQATNSLVSLVTKPGAITAQIHAYDAIAETLRDPNSPYHGLDIDGAMDTLRSKQGISRFLGYSPEGSPRVLTSVGMPFEDSLKFVNLKAPVSMKVSDIVSAAGGSFEGTLRNLGGQTAPLLKDVLQVMADRDFYFDRPLSDQTLRRVAKFSADADKLKNYHGRIPNEIWKKLDSVTQSVLNATDSGKGYYVADKYRLMAIKLIPGVSRALSTARMTSNEQIPDTEKVMRLFTGVRTQDVDPLKSINYDRIEQLEKFLEEKGLPRSKKKAIERMMLLEENQ